MKTRHWLFVILIAKIILAFFIPLGFDEAYYWVWSHHLQLSYFDHPPAISWLLFLGQPLENLGYLVRLPVILLGHGTLILWLILLRQLLGRKDRQKELLFILVSSANPFVGLGSIVATPDVPLNFFWAFSTMIMLKLLQTNQQKYATGLGLTLGLGFCSKYHMALFPIFSVVALIKKRDWRFLNGRWLLVILVCGIIASSPVIVWNYMNEFASFKFQLNHGFVYHKWTPAWVVEYLISQALLVSPVVLWAAWLNRDERFHFLKWTGLLTLLFFALTNLKAPSEANWPIMAYLPLIVVSLNIDGFKRALQVQSFIYAIVTSGLLFLMTSPSTRTHLGKLNEPFEYRQYSKEVKDFEPLFASKYQMASVFWFELKRPIYKLPEISRKDFFDSLIEKTDVPSKFYVILHSDKKLPQWILSENPTVNMVKELHSDLKVYEVIR